ncbi:MAG TPA: hypothetical protein VK834_11130 [Bradyrhizobium sp.]|nr:hypothetical protein [Bradyrhizobium sp.]
MTEPLPALPASAETTEILRFLHRFADLMSTGSNSDNLLRAARMLETHADLLKETTELLQLERIKGDAGAEMRKTLEARIDETEDEILALQAELSRQQSSANEMIVEMERRQGHLLQRAEQAEAALAAVQDVPPAIPVGSIAIELSTLRVAKAQFESLAQAFEKSGNIVSQVMCEASASSLDRVIRDSGAAESGDRSQHAA